ncbi:MAG: hypothetical protein PHE88_12360 [Elusimicrobia bacterium]|nr:hypothetical protein [Elusimicrobiota bacterium]
MAKKKRKWTQAERDAFARRMKKARGGTKTKRRKKKVMKKSTFTKEFPKVRKRSKRKGVPAMAKKNRRRSLAKSSKKSYRRTRKAGGGMGKAGVINMVKDAAVAIGGGLAAGMISNKLPIPQPMLKALSPALAGILLALTIGKRNKLVQQLATGMVVMGGVAAIRAQFPNVPLLAGEERVVVSPDLVGIEYDNDGNAIDYTGVEEIGVDEIGSEEYSTAADI